MATVQISDVHNELIKSIAEKEGIILYDITLQCGSTKGDNYLGVITNVIIKDRNSSKELNLVLKTASQNEEARKRAPIRLAYVREILIYKEVFETYEKLQDEFQVKNRFKAYPKCYGSFLDETNECLILENMKSLDYKMCSRKEPMNAEHIATVFTEYGKVHGLSFALQQHKPKQFEQFSKNMSNIFRHKMSEEGLEKFVLAKFNKLVDDFKDNEEVQKVLQKYIDERLLDFTKEIDRENLEYRVITHGDCWSNNMLFKYEDEKNPTKPTKMCLIDWQISSYTTPIHDLAYFFFVCSPKEVLCDYKSYLQIYYQSLSSMLTELQCDPSSIMTYDQFEDQWNKFCKIGLHISITILKIMLTEVEEVVTVDQLADSGKDFLNAFDYSSKNDEIYKKRMADIIIFLHKNNLLMT